MKLIVRGTLSIGLSLLTASAIWAASSNSDTLFPSNQPGISIYGEAGNGNVDVSPQQSVTHTTSSGFVAAPTQPAATPAPSADPPPETVHRSSSSTVKVTKTAAGTTTTRKTTTVSSRDRNQHNAAGGGISLQYFFTRYIGANIDTSFLGGTTYSTVVTANLLFRYPFEFGAKSETSGFAKDGKDGKSTLSGPTWGLAPYVLIGGGGQWDGRAAGIGEAGGGIELKFSQHYGIFAEGRYIFHDSHQGYAAETLGFTYDF
jgi:hypothetical protein